MQPAPTLVAAVLAFAATGLRAQHWSYRPIVRPQAPAVGDGWAASPLDRFAFAAMQQHGLRPAPPADRATWLRRVTLDLTGLPPTTDELDAFLADDGALARQTVVDALMSRPAFAERWAQWWLDLARYADSQGYEKDELRRTMWRWREWVIDAFARDLPFDQFTIEQLAGDLLPGATVEQRLATAFHRQTMTNTEGGTDDEEFRVAAVIDRVDTTMSVWMGSTLGCAQCHDHKYDRFTQREFFELFAFFDQTEDRDRDDDAPVLAVPTLQQSAAAKAIELDLAEVRKQLVAEPDAVAAWAAAVRRTHAQWLAARVVPATWRVLGPIRAASFKAAHRTVWAPERDGVRLDEQQEGQRWREVPEYVDGRVHGWNGDNSAVYLYRTIHAECAATATLSLGRDDAIKAWWNGVEVVSKEVGGAAAPDQEVLTVELRAGENTFLLKITNGGGPSGFYFALLPPSRGAELERVLAKQPAACDDDDRAQLRREYVARAPELAGVRARIAQLERDFDAQRGPAVPVLRELPADKRRTTRVHRRGSFLDQGDPVSAAVPAVWPALPAGATRDRLGLARWLVANDNPLTARVVANRVWSELFGTGIVTTLEDFGTQGDAPTHPELLDWLATEFRDHGWSLRHLLRTIVLSATYGQSSAATAAVRELDPHNQWLARGPALRLTAEMVRDQVLAVAGLLSAKVGGPSVMPPQPDGVWQQLYSGARWQAATNEDAYRRSLYTFWRRTSPHPAMLMFDAQSRESCVLRRQRSNTPLQALVAWNEPQFAEAAKALAVAVFARFAGDDDDADARTVDWLWRRCLLRAPTAKERDRLLALLHEERCRFRAEPAAAAAMFAPGPCSQELELAPWAVVAGVVLALDELVVKR
jgi:hypothetical protein